MSEAKYAHMNPGDFLAAVGDDAQKWADAFCEMFPQMEHDVMVGWFANAIENSGDVRRSRLFRNDEAFCDFVDDVMMHRRFLRDLDAAA